MDIYTDSYFILFLCLKCRIVLSGVKASFEYRNPSPYHSIILFGSIMFLSFKSQKYPQNLFVLLYNICTIYLIYRNLSFLLKSNKLLTNEICYTLPFPLHIILKTTTTKSKCKMAYFSTMYQTVTATERRDIYARTITNPRKSVRGR